MEDEQAFRGWVAEAATLVDDVGNLTESDADDRAGQLLKAIAGDGEAWARFYGELLPYTGSGLSVPSLNRLQITADCVEAELDEVLSVWMILAGAIRLSILS